MNFHQTVALMNHCRLGCETARPSFCYDVEGSGGGIVLTVNSGYE
jgi:hypothetical protein